VPAHAPRDFHEALQSYWFCHLAVITELNGWDSFNPGHLDRHLLPFYQRGLAAGTLTRESARELLECFFIKFNNHPAPPKVGVTAAESGTYTDFANINLGGLLADGTDGSNEVSDLLLDIVDEMHLLQPSTNNGPAAVIKSAGKMDHVKTGGTLLNLKFSPGLVATEEGLDKWAHLVRSYFKMDGHHVQFNVVTATTLRTAQAQPEQHRDLIVRVAGYSDYFCDLSVELQDEIISRTEHEGF
jgi:pyruvate-formate lyase